MIIQLTRGIQTTVDDEDFEWLSKWSWHVGIGKHPVVRRGSGIRMAREIMNAPKGLEVDHIDNNPLNNCRSNLRLVTHQQNMMNRKKFEGKSRFKGVSLHQNPNTEVTHWMSRIIINKKGIYLGIFDKEIDAALAYDKAAKRIFGDYAWLNFPEI